MENLQGIEIRGRRIRKLESPHPHTTWPFAHTLVLKLTLVQKTSKYLAHKTSPRRTVTAVPTEAVAGTAADEATNTATLAAMTTAQGEITRLAATTITILVGTMVFRVEIEATASLAEATGEDPDLPGTGVTIVTAIGEEVPAPMDDLVRKPS